MDQHSTSYEQYCWVKKRNVVLEETVFHNGTKTLRCTSLAECKKDGGCKNSVLEHLWDKKFPFMFGFGNSDN